MKTASSELYAAINALTKAKASLYKLIVKKEGKENVERRMTEVNRYLAEIIPTQTKVAIYLATAKNQRHDKVMDIEHDGFYHFASDNLGDYLNWLETTPSKSTVTKENKKKSAK